MVEQDLDEIWQVEVRGQIYEAPFGEFHSWIEEGSLQPLDRMRSGDLRWIEAKRVPALAPLFEAKEYGLPIPPLAGKSTASENVPEIPSSAVTAINDPVGVEPVVHEQIIAPKRSFDPNFCSIHADAPAAFLCDSCNQTYCKACPKSYGGTVKVCPDCGSLCHSVGEIKQKEERTAAKAAAISSGFGAQDFFAALAHPFNFKVSLIVGGLMFAFFSIGRNSAYFGGIYMVVGALFSAMFANTLTFGVLSNTVDNFSTGRIDANFMPSFDDFSLWDDVIHPFFLSIAAYIVAFGPFIVFLIVGAYFVLSSVSSHMQSVEADLQKLPGTPYYAPNNTVEQTNQVKELVGDLDEQVEERNEFQNQITIGNSNATVDQETRDQEKLWEQVQQSRKAELESVIGKTPETRAAENAAFIQGFLKLAAPIVIIGAICLLWGLFYFPVACAIAGYTRSFMSTLNPLVGLDTIKRLGGTYFSILFMSLILLIAAGIVNSILAMIFAPFDLPGLGNMPALAIGNLITFYLCTVFSCILGYAMYKKAHRLQL